MIQINKRALEPFMGPIGPIPSEASAFLFIISTKNQRLKKIDLDHLNPIERKEKLKKWGKELRFVAVIEKADQVFVHLHETRAEQFKNQADLTFKGKKITVESLTDKQAEELAIVGQAFEQYLAKQDEKKEVGKDSGQGLESLTGFFPNEFFAFKNLICDKTQIHLLFNMVFASQMNNIINRHLERVREARLEEKRLKEADDKANDIKVDEINRDILRTDVRKTEIIRNLKRSFIREELVLVSAGS